MARLVASYDDCYGSRGMISDQIRCLLRLNKLQDHSPNLVVMLDQLEAFDTEVVQDLVYACRYAFLIPLPQRQILTLQHSKHLDSLPILFIVSLSETAYLQRAFTTSTRMMLDTTVFQPSSGPSLCSEVVRNVSRCCYFQIACAKLFLNDRHCTLKNHLVIYSWAGRRSKC